MALLSLSMWNEVADVAPACFCRRACDGETPGWAFGWTAIQFKRGGGGGGGAAGGDTSNVVRQLSVAGECPVADPRTAEPLGSAQNVCCSSAAMVIRLLRAGTHAAAGAAVVDAAADHSKPLRYGSGSSRARIHDS